VARPSDTILTLNHCQLSTPPSGHGVRMKQPGGKTSSRRRRIRGGAASKRAADARALALLPTIRKLMAAGFVSERGLATKLNRKGLSGGLGGRWHRSSVRRTLIRLGLITVGRGRANIRLAHKRAADARATALAATIRKLRRAGFVSNAAIARELNLRGIPTAQGSKWHPFGVTRLLERLEKLDSASSSGRHHR
jgi:hypothetical protein